MILYLKYFQFNEKKCSHVSLIAYDREKNKHLLFDFYPNNSKTIDLKSGNPSEQLIDCYTVTFNVTTLTFDDLHKKLKQSKYSDCKNYQHTDNCVNAVIFALKACGINLKLEQGYKFKHLFSCFFAPTKLITPKELFATAMEYQYNTNQKQDIETALKQLSSDQISARPFLIAFKDLLKKNQSQLTDIEKKAAIYIIERFKCFIESPKEMEATTLIRECKAAALSFRGSPSYARGEVGGMILILGIVLAFISALFFILNLFGPSKTTTQKSMTLADDQIAKLTVGAFLTIVAGLILMTSGDGFGLYKDISVNLAKLDSITPQNTEKTGNLLHLKI